MFFLHFSGPRLAIRVRDQNAPLRKNFSGLKWYPANPAYAVKGKFTPLAAPKVVQAPTILGDLEPFTVPGNVAVTIDGKTANMEAWKSGDRLWFVFRDLTSADATYPSARFLYTDAPRQGRQRHARFQSRAESAVRLQPVDDMPAAAVGQ